jgi:plastocyanin
MGAYAVLNRLLTGGLHFCRHSALLRRAPAREPSNEVNMSFRDALIRLRRPFAVAATTAFLSIGLGTLVGLALPQYSISQKGREFHPDEITIKRGETIQIVNDDADLIHHAYIDSPTFSFDSGDQQPGSKTDITFAVAGDFNVLCAIHPKMRLVVHVQ